MLIDSRWSAGMHWRRSPQQVPVEKSHRDASGHASAPRFHREFRHPVTATSGILEKIADARGIAVHQRWQYHGQCQSKGRALTEIKTNIQTLDRPSKRQADWPSTVLCWAASEDEKRHAFGRVKVHNRLVCHRASPVPHAGW